MTNDLKRFQIKASPKVLGVFDALCEAAHVDRDSGFACLLLDFFEGCPGIQAELEQDEYREWVVKSRQFVMDHCF